MSLLPRVLSVSRRSAASDVRGESGAEADVRVDVGTWVVQVECEHPGVGTVVPVPATKRQPY